MEFIPATATAVDKLERQAKTLSQTTGTPLRAAQAIVAQHNGYARWKHVNDCCTQTVALSGKKPLPAALQQVLDRAAERQPASVVSQGAFAHGFVFAMDVKDAQEISLGRTMLNVKMGGISLLRICGRCWPTVGTKKPAPYSPKYRHPTTW